MKSKISLAQFISTRRENAGLSQRGLAKRSNLPLETIESIEAGQELFLATTIRQKLAKGLKLDSKTIKEYEKSPDDRAVSLEAIENIKVMVLAGETAGVKCPACGAKLICRVAEMYDMEDNLVKHPKARCSVCPFQVK